MEFFVKIVDWIQPLTIFTRDFILGASQGYEYASDKSKQNFGALSLISQKKLRQQSLKIFSIFKFNFIFTLLPCSETLLPRSSMQVPLISNWFTHAVEHIWYKSAIIYQFKLITKITDQLLEISLVKVKKSKVNYAVLF